MEHSALPISNIENLEIAVEAFLAKETSPTPARIRELIEQFRVIEHCSIDDSAAEKLARQFEMRHGVTMTIGAMLTKREFEPWLNSARPTIVPYYWDRYEKLLGAKRLSNHVIRTLDEVTDRTLGRLGNPSQPGPWDRRGMVVGHVQSGKTANYIGLICKAADAGYRLIVVIAGIHNNLRNQTQLRIDEGFVGRDSARLLSLKNERLVGVGRYDQTRRPVTFTNSVKDFNKQMATGLGIPLQNLNEPAVLVIKKHPTTLKNLLDWLREHSAKGGGTKVDTPMLLIDDEADNASINIRYAKDEVSRINGQIRDLLNLFERSCYVGYTATPFANIFIDPSTDDEMLGDDLFPRDFIVSLDPPSNYFGPHSVFLNDEASVIRYIEDNEDRLPLKHTIDFVVEGLPESLIDAIRTFILGRAIRLARKENNSQGLHCSMLVNASRFTNVQKQLRNAIHTRLKCIQSSLRINGALPHAQACSDPEIASLYKVWQNEYCDAEFDWSDVLGLLHEAAAPITVVEVNSTSSGTLNYADHNKNGLNVIAVGGFSLSRGLTVEGLMVSYFLRNSMMYDTLMQMGRWFGYRPDYDDLCRVWMHEEAEGWYAHIAESIEMLREEFRTMEAADATPEEFGLKVRSHPDTLIVTARNKMGSGERVVVSIGLGNSFVETAVLKRKETSLEMNRQAAMRFSRQLEEIGKPLSESQKVPGGWLLNEVPAVQIIDFLNAFDNHPMSMLTDPAPIRQYIEQRRDNELALWDVLFASTARSNDSTLQDLSLGIPINCQRRTAGLKSDIHTLRITNKQRVASRGAERTGLTEADIEAAEHKYRVAEGMKNDQSCSLNYPDRIYRTQRTKPLLILHLLKIDSEPGGKVHSRPVVAWSISFPRTQLADKRVEYVVNTTWLSEKFRNDIAQDEIRDNHE